jgi:hypothetical protein
MDDKEFVRGVYVFLCLIWTGLSAAELALVTQRVTKVFRYINQLSRSGFLL